MAFTYYNPKTKEEVESETELTPDQLEEAFATPPTPGFFGEMGKGFGASFLNEAKSAGTALRFLGDMSKKVTDELGVGGAISESLQEAGKFVEEDFDTRMKEGGWEPTVGSLDQINNLSDFGLFAGQAIGNMAGFLAMNVPLMLTGAGEAKLALKAPSTIKGLLTVGKETSVLGSIVNPARLAQLLKPSLTEIPIGIAEIGATYEDLGKEGEASGLDMLKAAAGAYGATKLERLGLETILGRFGIGAGAVKTAGKGILRRMGEGVLAGGAVEGGEEFVQTYAERWGAGKDVTSKEAFMEALTGGVAGAIGGGLFGGIGGVFKPGMSEQEKNDKIEGLMTDANADPAMRIAAANYIAERINDQYGELAEDVPMHDVNGKPVLLADGKPAMINGVAQQFLDYATGKINAKETIDSELSLDPVGMQVETQLDEVKRIFPEVFPNVRKTPEMNEYKDAQWYGQQRYQQLTQMSNVPGLLSDEEQKELAFIEQNQGNAKIMQAYAMLSQARDKAASKKMADIAAKGATTETVTGETGEAGKGGQAFEVTGGKNKGQTAVLIKKGKAVSVLQLPNGEKIQVKNKNLKPYEEPVTPATAEATPTAQGQPAQAKPEPYLLTKEEYTKGLPEGAQLKVASQMHEQAVMKAIADGKIESHPDYPQLSKTKGTAPSTELKEQSFEDYQEEKYPTNIPGEAPRTGSTLTQSEINAVMKGANEAQDRQEYDKAVKEGKIIAPAPKAKEPQAQAAAFKSNIAEATVKVNDKDNTFDISAPIGKVNGYTKNADMPGEKASPTRGTIFWTEATQPKAGAGKKLFVEALRLMAEQGTKTVVTIPTSESGKALVNSMVREGYIEEPSLIKGQSQEHKITIDKEGNPTGVKKAKEEKKPPAIPERKKEPEVEAKEPEVKEKTTDTMVTHAKRAGTVDNVDVRGLADYFEEYLVVNNQPKNVQAVQKILTAVYGESIPTTSPQYKYVEEAYEAALVRTARKIAYNDLLTNDERYAKIKELYNDMPLLAQRTSASIKKQQYSTPLPLAYILKEAFNSKGKVADLAGAGNGALLIASTSPGKTTANEIDETRQMLLMEFGVNKLYKYDGQESPPEELTKSQDVIVVNPPFGSLDEKVTYNDYIIGKLEHLMTLKSLEAMKDDGKAGIIIGEHNFRDNGKMTDLDTNFLNYLYSNYNVTHNIDINGDVYAKQGTKFPIRLIIIEGRKAAEDNSLAPLKDEVQSANTFDEVRKELGGGNGLPKVVAKPDSGLAGTGTEGQQPTVPAKTTEPEGGLPGKGTTRPGGSVIPPKGTVGVGKGEGIPEGTPSLETGAGSPPISGGTVSGVGEREVNPFDIFDETKEAELIEKIKKRLEAKEKGEKAPVTTATTPTETPATTQTTQAPWTDPGQKTKSDVAESYGETVQNNPEAQTIKKFVNVFDESKLGDLEKELNDLLNRCSVNPMFDPKLYSVGMQVGGIYIQKGINALAEWTNAMINKFGERIKPFLNSIWESLRHYPQDEWFDADLMTDMFQFSGIQFKRGSITKEELLVKLNGAFGNAEKYIDAIYSSIIAYDGKPMTEVVTEMKNTYQAAYVARSKGKSGGNLTPKNMAQNVQDALTRIEMMHGSIDAFVAQKLRYKDVSELMKRTKDGWDRFSAEQIDAIALAIDMIDQGKGMIIGDQTGIGKGRVGAAIIRYANLRGNKPIFITANPKLFSDLYRDLEDIEHKAVPFIMHDKKEAASILDNDGNKIFDPSWNPKVQKIIDDDYRNGSKEVMADFDFVAMPYSQIQNPKHSGLKRRMLSALAPGNIIVMDESHMASGDSNTGQFLATLLQQAKAVTYMSATYAKRTDSMPIYFRTNMGDAGMSLGELINAISAGGVPFQQILAMELTKAGQYIRRETDLSLIGMDIHVNMESKETDTKTTDTITRGLRAIVDFSNMMSAWAETETGRKQAGGNMDHLVTTSNFASTVHNVVSQMMLSIKSDMVVEQTLNALERNEKPVIVLSNTMANALDFYIDFAGLKEGDTVGITFKDVLQKALYSTLKVTEKDRHGQKTVYWLKPEELPGHLATQFSRIQGMIDAMDVTIPASPIDYMKFIIEQYGNGTRNYRVGELTGRKPIIKYDEGGESATLGKRTESEINNKNKPVNGFNNGTIDCLIINSSGSTGISLHASETFKDTRKRTMIIAQPHLNIDTFIQTLGRVNRKGQIIEPKYILMQTALPTELRPAVILQKKMTSLNANTTANAESHNTLKNIPDMMNRYGDQVMVAYLAENPDIDAALGHPNTDADAFRKVSGKAALLPVSMQERMFDELESRYTDHIQYLTEIGENELVAKDYDFKAETLMKIKLFDGDDETSPFKCSAWLERVKIRNTKRPFNRAKILKLIEENTKGDTEFNKNLIAQIKSHGEAYLAEQKEVQSEETFNILEIKTNQYMRRIENILSRFSPGEVFELYLTQTKPGETPDSVRGVVTNVTFVPGTTGNPVLPSKVRVTFAVNDAKQTITIACSRNTILEEADWEQSYYFDSWDSRLKDTETETRHIITGNILRGLAAATSAGHKGQVITFSDKEGVQRYGILMPKNLDAKIEDEYTHKTVDYKEALTYIEGRSNYFDSQIDTSDDAVRITKPKWGNQYTIFVPKSKAKGEKYFQDEELKALTVENEFSGRGNTLSAHILPENLEKVMQLVSAKHSLKWSIPRDNNDTVKYSVGDKGAAKRPVLFKHLMFVPEVSRYRYPDLIHGKFLAQVDDPATLLDGGMSTVTYDPEQHEIWNTDDFGKALMAGKNSDIAIEIDDMAKRQEEFKQALSKYFYSNRPIVANSDTLREIQKIFKGQRVTLDKEGNFVIVTETGFKVTVKSVDHIDVNEMALKLGYGKTSTTGVISGQYYTGEIKLTRGKADSWTFAHESMHFLEDVGLITKLEQKVLKVEINKLVKAGKFSTVNMKDIGGEEDRANYIAMMLGKKEEPKGVFGRIIDTVRRWANMLAEAFGRKEVTPEGIVKLIQSGEVFKRQGDREHPYIVDKKAAREIEVGQQLFNAQNTSIEHTFPVNDGNADYFIEAAGDIFRELTKPNSDHGYIKEKFRRLHSITELNAGDVEQTIDEKSRVLKQGTNLAVAIKEFRKKVDNLKMLMQDSSFSERKKPLMAAALDLIHACSNWVNEPNIYDKALWDSLDKMQHAYDVFLEKEKAVKYHILDKEHIEKAKDSIGSWTKNLVDLHKDTDERKLIRELMVSHKDMGYFRLYMGLPWWNAKRYGEWAQAFDIFGIRRPETRGRLIHDLIYIADPFFRMKTEKRIPVEKLLIEGDATLGAEYRELMQEYRKTGDKEALEKANKIKELNRYSDEQLREGITTYTGETIKLDDEQIDAYKKVRATYDEVYDRYFEHLTLLTMDKYKGQKWYQLLLQVHGVDLTGEEAQKTKNILDRISSLTHQKISVNLKELFDAVAKGVKETPADERANVAELYGSIYKRLVKQIGILKETLNDLSDGELTDAEQLKQAKEVIAAYMRTLPEMKKIRALRNAYGKQIAFHPRVRPQGKFKVTVVEDVRDKEGNILYTKEHFSKMFNSESEGVSIFKEAQSVADNIKGSRVEQGKVIKTSESAFTNVSDINMMQIITNAVEKMKMGGKLDEETNKMIRNQLYRTIANEFKSRGWGSHLIRRQKSLIKGYQEDDLPRILYNYVTGFAGMVTKQVAAKQWLEMMSGIKDKSTKLYKSLEKYGNDQLRNAEPLDKLSGKVRSGMFIWYLGGSFRSAFLQITQNFTTGMPALQQYMRKHGIQGLAEKEYGTAIKDITLNMDWKTGRNKANSKLGILEQQMEDELFTDGVTRDQYIQEISGQMGTRFGNAYEKTIWMLAFPFSRMELLNRQGAALGMFRIAFKQATEQGMQESDAYKFARDKARSFVYDTHYFMGKENLPPYASGGSAASVAARTAYTFRGFLNNYLEWMFGDKDWKRMVHSLAYIAIFGGLLGMPLIKDLFEMIESKTGYSPLNFVKKSLRGIGGKTLETMGVHGLPAVMGANISGSISIGVPFTEGILPTATGVWGGLGIKVGRGAESFARGDLYRGFENLLPEFIASPMKAIRMSEAGKAIGQPGIATTPRGGAMIDETGKPVQLGTGEAALKMAGFNPTSYSEQMELNQGVKRQKEYFRNRYEDIAEEYKIEYAKGNKTTAMQKLMKDAKVYNMDIKNHELTGLISPMKVSNIVRSTRITKQQRREQTMKQRMLAGA